jgi:hypothetical protein
MIPVRLFAIMPEKETKVATTSAFRLMARCYGSIAKWRSRVLLIHGDADRNVPLPANQIPDEIHDLLRWTDWMVVTASALIFSRPR